MSISPLDFSLVRFSVFRNLVRIEFSDAMHLICCRTLCHAAVGDRLIKIGRTAFPEGKQLGEIEINWRRCDVVFV
jgi:hypothetical protein